MSPETRPESAGSTSDARAAADLLGDARRLAAAGQPAEAAHALAQVAVVSRELAPWLAAARQVAALPQQDWARRKVRLAVLGSHTTGHLVPALVTAAAAVGVALDVYEAPYGQWQQEILDPASGLAEFSPDVVLLAVDSRELHFPARSEAPTEDLATAVERWTSSWRVLRERLHATVIQLSFVEPPEDEFGSLALTLPGSRRRQIRALNLALGDVAPSGVHLVDAEAVAARVGSAAWADRRYWYRSKHAIGLGALPELAAEVAQVLAGALGLNRKVVVVDLDGTVWGGVVGEDGPAGITVGNGPSGEAFQAFQEHLIGLQQRGMLLVAVSKNNDAEARAPFLERPEMRLKLEHFAVFMASWDDKVSTIQRVAEELGLGLDSFVFVDDNPVEREAVRRALPEVGVVPLPVEPADYVAALTAFPGMQVAAFTADDERRTQQYRSRAQFARGQTAAGSREEFLAGLDMVLTVEEIGEANLQRAVQLIGKTNQFNLTGRRRGAPEITEMAGRPGAATIALRLRDRFDDHGIIGVVLAVPEGEALVIDTWVMSCRVLGRDVELATMAALAERARATGAVRIRGFFVPTGRNTPARAAYSAAGFMRPEGAAYSGPAVSPGVEEWVLDLSAPGPVSTMIRIQW